MGCTHSKVEDEEAVRRCKDRRKLMKQLVRRRVDLAAAHSAYLRALRNTGATLRQFAEVESALSQQPPAGLSVHPSPPRPPPPPPAYSVSSSIPPAYSVTSSMPPSPRPPPPLPFSPITIRKREKRDGDLHGDDSMDDDDDTDSCSTPLPPPPPPGTEWEYLDPFPMRPLNFPSLLADRNDREVASQVTMDDDNWVETNTEFDGEEDESVSGNVDGIVRGVQLNPSKSRALGDDNSSMVSWVTKDSDSSVVVRRSKKSLVAIVKEIDAYFLKAAASGSDVVILLDSAGGRPDPSADWCVFCDIARRAPTSTTALLYSDDKAVAFQDINPSAFMHYLVIPIEHIPTVKNLQRTKEDHQLVSHMVKVGKDLLNRDAPNSKEHRFGFHQPPFNSVDHLHLHCLALPFMPSWRQVKYTPLGPLGGFVEDAKLLERIKPQAEVYS